MTHDERIAAAKAYYQHATAEKTELGELQKRISSIQKATSGITGIPTLAKLSAFLSAVKKALEG